MSTLLAAVMFIKEPSQITQGAPAKLLSSSDYITELRLNLPCFCLLSVDLEPLKKFGMLQGFLTE